jgi:hypothetical protein
MYQFNTNEGERFTLFTAPAKSENFIVLIVTTIQAIVKYWKPKQLIIPVLSLIDVFVNMNIKSISVLNKRKYENFRICFR